MSEELVKVLAKADSYLEDAIYLYEGSRYESAVNRSYYSMFVSIQELLLSKDIFVKTHSGTKVKFHELFLKTTLLPLDLGKIFEDALMLRQDADYDFKFEVTQSDALQTINDAKIFLAAIKSYLKNNS
jgi:uncharacterized protein (UPF0332 family)